MLDFSKYKDRSIKCAGLGEVLFDVYPSGPKIGGAPANFAYHCQQNGLKAMAISSVGKDKLGFMARDLLACRFLPALLLENDKPTGAVNIELSPDGVPSYTFLEDTAYDNIPTTELLLETASTLDMVCFGSLAQRNCISHQTIMNVLDAMPKDSLKIFDVNLRRSYYSKEIIDESLKRSQIFKCNEDELPILCAIANLKEKSSSAYNHYLIDQGIDCFIFTEGAVQSTVYLNNEISVIKTPVVENVVDTVGAGDSFTATLISQLMKGRSLREAHHKAVNLSAYVCTQKGAMPDVPYDLIK